MDARDIILRPIITESSMSGVENKRYQFEVDTHATKPQIKWAIKKIFDVDVKSVNTANVRGKLKRQGRYAGMTRKRKKAVITLTKDSKDIQIFNEG